MKRSGGMLSWALAIHVLSATCCLGAEQPSRLPRDYHVQPAPFNQVHVDDDFWTPRLETSRTVTIPYAFEQCEATDRISNFRKAAGLLEGEHQGIHFNDSDVYKVMEGAAYSLQVRPDKGMREYLDELVGVMAASLKINGEHVPLDVRKGYARIERRWKQGDTIDFDLPLPVRRIVSHPDVTTNQGKVALQRGPVVYCLEGPDNDGQVLDLVIPDEAELTAQFRPDLLNGVVTISGQAQTAKRTLDGRIVPDSERSFTAIPYYAWAHRGRAQMTVWPARIPEAARPKPADTLTYTSKTTASFVHVSLEAVKDQILPANSADSSGLQLDFWPHKGTTEWVQFEWDETHEISSVKVYWFDDTGRGACRVPKSWRVFYQDAGGEFQPVKHLGPYGAEKDTFNKVEFDPVNTWAIKLEITLEDRWAAGIQEVVIE